MNLPEQGISGPFRITAIKHILPQKRPEDDGAGEGFVFRPVTGIFIYKSNDVWTLTFDKGDTLGVVAKTKRPLPLLRLISHKAHAAFFAAIAVALLYFLSGLLVAGDDPRHFYNFFMWLLYVLPVTYGLSWLYAFLVVPVWSKYRDWSLSGLNFSLLFLVNTGLVLVVLVSLTGGVETICQDFGDRDFWILTAAIALHNAAVCAALLGGWARLRAWWERYSQGGG